MIQPPIERNGERGTYACMLWNVKSGRPTVVTLYDDLPDRWLGRRCVVAATSVEAPLEIFMKSAWRRGEPPARQEAEAVRPASAARAHIPAGLAGFRP